MKKPAPISMTVAKKKPPRKKVAPPIKEVAPFNMDAPEHKPAKRLRDPAVKQLQKDVAELKEREVVVNVAAPAPRARITRVKIKYDPFGAPAELIPTYSE